MPPPRGSTQSMPRPKTARRYKPYTGPPPRRSPSPSKAKQTLWKRVIGWVQHVNPALFPGNANAGDSRRNSRSTLPRSRTSIETPTRPQRLQKREPIPQAEARRALSAEQAQQWAADATANALPQHPEPSSQQPKKKKARSIFGLSALLENFSYDVERSFLTPFEAQVLDRITKVTDTGRFIARTQLGREILLMPDRESANAVAAVRSLARSTREHDQEMLCRDLDRLLTREQRAVLRRVLFSNIEVRCDGTESRCRTPDSVAQPVEERTMRPGPARAVTFGEPPRVASRLGVLDSPTPAPRDAIVVRHDIEIRRGSGLRGGGGDNEEAKSSRPTFDLSNLIRRPRRLEDEERPHPVLWWLAGGRIRQDRPGAGVPTAATLRERRVVDAENRDAVGFWDTVAGIRAVQRTRSQLADICQRVQSSGGEEGEAVKDEAEADKAKDEAKDKDESKDKDKEGEEAEESAEGEKGADEPKKD